MDAVIKKIEQNTKDTKIFTLKLDTKLRFISGQCIKLSIPGVEFSRVYSISSAGGDTDEITLTIKVYDDGKFTKEIDRLKVNDAVIVEGPFGSFTFNGDTDKNIVLIAGGSGISTLHSIMRFILDNNYRNKVKLLYSAKTTEEVIYRQEIEELKEKYDNFDPLIILTNEDKSHENPKRRLTTQEINDNIEDKNSLFYICGPLGFVNFIIEKLKEIGINKENIKTEKYGKEI